MTDDTYNGWTNRETWATSLHLMNDQGFYNDVVAITSQTNNPAALALAIESYVDGLIEDYGDASRGVKMMRDEIGSLWRVNWVELAESYWEDYRESED